MLTEHKPKELNAEEAREFLVIRLVEQALLERAPLSDIEKRILTFSESDPAADFSALDAFNENHNTDEFETRIIKLVRRAYRFDRKRNCAEAWEMALRALKSADFYLMGIIQRRGLWSDSPKSEPSPVRLSMWVVFVILTIFGYYLSPPWARNLKGLKELSFAGLCTWFVINVILITWQRLQDRD